MRRDCKADYQKPNGFLGGALRVTSLPTSHVSNSYISRRVPGKGDVGVLWERRNGSTSRLGGRFRAVMLTFDIPGETLVDQRKQSLRPGKFGGEKRQPCRDDQQCRSRRKDQNESHTQTDEPYANQCRSAEA